MVIKSSQQKGCKAAYSIAPMHIYWLLVYFFEDLSPDEDHLIKMNLKKTLPPFCKPALYQAGVPFPPLLQ